MKIRERFKLLVIALTLIIICIPMAIIITIFSNPFFLWIENTFSIESVGHSGPAEWCYIAVYIILLGASGFIWFKYISQKTIKK